MKIAMIGAGSIVFCKTLLNDLMATPALAGAEFALMSPTEPKLRRMEAFARRMLADNGLPGSVWATTDRREAIRNADFVVSMIQIGGVDAFEQDYKIPLKYGVDQCIADSLGPGGIFRGLRTIPVLVVSTDATSHRVDRMMSLGAKGYVAKPFSPETLRHTMEQLLGVPQ